MEDSIHVKGLSDLQKFLDTLPEKLQKNVMRGAVRAGMTRIKDAAFAAAPVGPPSKEGARKYGLYAGAMRDSIRITTSIKGNLISASVKVGGKTKHGANVWYARIIEFTGAAHHDITPKVGGSLFLGGVFLHTAHHPGMRPKAFMRPAFDAQAQNAVIGAAEYIKTRLATKEGLDTSGVLVEGDEP